MEVKSRLALDLLNIGFEDSASAVIYKQFPIGTDHNTLTIGSAIDLFLNQAKSNTIA